jgi:hypothetical protein
MASKSQVRCVRSREGGCSRLRTTPRYGVLGVCLELDSSPRYPPALFTCYRPKLGSDVVHMYSPTNRAMYPSRSPASPSRRPAPMTTPGRPPL